MRKRMTDKRFLHMIGQCVKDGYVEGWRYHQTYSGVPQGGTLSPVLSNIYLNELDQMMATKITEYNRGKERVLKRDYDRLRQAMRRAKHKARAAEEWTRHKALKQQMRKT